jgi:hypothetical protein
MRPLKFSALNGGADQIDDGFTESRRLEKAEANGGRICLPNDSEDWSSSIQFLAVEFDDIAVWVEDVDLRVARGGMGTKLHLSEVVVGNIVAESLPPSHASVSR